MGSTTDGSSVGRRWRIVTQTNGEEHVGSTVLTEEEALEQLDVETRMHAAAGWRVERHNRWLAASKYGTVRVVAMRQLTPMEDE